MTRPPSSPESPAARSGPGDAALRPVDDTAGRAASPPETWDGVFLINGLGMGNSTRCHAVIQELVALGVRVHVLTSGNGLRFFRYKPEIASLTEVESYFYGVSGHRLSAWRTLMSLGELGRRARRKRLQVEALLTALRPAFCVTDSEYTVAPFKRRGIPVIALNNSDVVVSEYLRMRDKPRNLRGQFWAIEYLDYLFHRSRVDLVISPAAQPLPPRHPRIRRVGLIVRREIDALAQTARAGPPVPPRDYQKLTFMLSGSALGRTQDLSTIDLPYQIAVVGLDGPNTARVTFHGKLLNNIARLAEADLLLVNGGFSAVSEALALRKPTLVIPLARHAEQYVNARQVVDLGLGAMTTEHDLVGLLRQMYADNVSVIRGDNPPRVDHGGARQAAEIVMRFVEAGRPAARPSGG